MPFHADEIAQLYNEMTNQTSGYEPEEENIEEQELIYRTVMYDGERDF